MKIPSLEYKKFKVEPKSRGSSQLSGNNSLGGNTPFKHVPSGNHNTISQ